MEMNNNDKGKKKRICFQDIDNKILRKCVKGNHVITKRKMDSEISYFPIFFCVGFTPFSMVH